MLLNQSKVASAFPLYIYKNKVLPTVLFHLSSNRIRKRHFPLIVIPKRKKPENGQ